MRLTHSSYYTIIVGSGAAGYSAADRLYQFGVQDIAIVTEGRTMGTSRNTGSDKQTYYKLTLSGDKADSFTEMAKTLFDGQSMDGDLALVEAVNSVPCFLHLTNLGVPFPTNSWGEYVGYKTDHDPRQRATSAGPLTSKLMTEALERSVMERNIPILDHYQMIQILTDQEQVYGILCLDTEKGRLVVLHCKYLILATGGPAGMYADSVYPASQHGASGIAFDAGIIGKNLTEWQYGLASVAPRWNVSGTYMQSLPRFISTKQDGSDPQEFLLDAFSSYGDMLSQIFLKGYQWPFDSRKAMNGSSRIDLLVYNERVLKGRRVFLDYRSNSSPIPWDRLSGEASAYLQKAGALQDTPYERLNHMNRPAVEFYLNHGIDLSQQMLEIALCAQHNNGGLHIDNWWRTNIKGIFAIGEAAGSHGVYRPGGSALNAGQVGALRAARFIAAQEKTPVDTTLPEECKKQLHRTQIMINSIQKKEGNTTAFIAYFRTRMSEVGGAFRSLDDIYALEQEVHKFLIHFKTRVGSGGTIAGLSSAFRLYDQLICMDVYLLAMGDYAIRCHYSRGSALYYHRQGQLPELSLPSIPEIFRFSTATHPFMRHIQEVQYSKGRKMVTWRKVNPIPDRSQDFFENIWRTYRENQNIIKEN